MTNYAGEGADMRDGNMRKARSGSSGPWPMGAVLAGYSCAEKANTVSESKGTPALWMQEGKSG